jgi:hypothetical protein
MLIRDTLTTAAMVIARDVVPTSANPAAGDDALAGPD